MGRLHIDLICPLQYFQDLEPFTHLTMAKSVCFHNFNKISYTLENREVKSTCCQVSIGPSVSGGGGRIS